MGTAVDPQEQRLQRIASILQRGVVANAALTALVLVLAVLAAVGLIPSLYTLLHRVLLALYPGADDAAVALVILATLVNVSLMLVMMVGVQAREIWVLAGLALVMLANLIALIVYGYTPALITLGFGGWALVRLARGARVLRANPVMIRELRGRMRGARAFVVMSVYLALLSGFALLLYVVFGSINSLNASAATGQVGRILFAGIVGIELVLIIFIAPSFTAGAVTGERERQTYDLVRTTLLTTPSFITGKLESSLGYILLLLLAAIPLQSIAFLFGGVSETEVLLAFLILMVTAVTFGTVGIYFSASQPRTLSASVRTYAMIGVWAFVAPFVIAFIVRLIENGLFGSSSAANAPALEALLKYADLFITSLNPFTTAIMTQQLLVGQQVGGFYTVTLASNGSTIPMIAPWVVFTILYLGIAAVLIVLTMRRTRKIDLMA